MQFFILSVITSVHLISLSAGDCHPQVRQVPVDPGEHREAIEKGTAAYERRDFGEAFATALPYANAGIGEFQFTLGILLEMGYNEDGRLSYIERETQSLSWYLQAALNCNRPAMERLSDIYTHGWLGRPKNLEIGQCWMTASIGETKPAICASLK